jgi:transmembrane sensor
MTITELTETGVEAEAAEWAVTLHEKSLTTSEADASLREDQHAQFVTWLQRSERHVAEFLHADDTFCRLAELDPHNRINLDDILARSSRGVTPHHSALTLAGQRSLSWRNPRVLACAASLVICLVAVFAWMAYERTHVFTTRVGEQRVVTLPDRSMMTLNTNSRAVVEFSKTARLIRLTKGEALFAVEHDPEKPFLVVTPNAIVRAVGTQFDVYQRENATTTVTVVEGVVRVIAAHGDATASIPEGPAPIGSPKDSSGEARLSAGEQARVKQGDISKSETKDVTQIVAWREQLLVFRDVPLSEVAEQFNRYNSTHIYIEDPEIGARLMNGTYSTNRPEILLKYLEKDNSVAVTTEGGSWIVRQR